MRPGAPVPGRGGRPAGPAAAVPAGFAVIVVDNGSTDGTADVARALGATVVHESAPGYGAAVHAGLLAATSDHVAFMDGDGSFDPAELLPLLDDVRSGRADLAVGRRRPVARGVWPWHARLGNDLVVWWLRRRIGMPAHDIAPIRVCRRDGPARPGRPGPSVRLPGRAAAEGDRRGLARTRARRRLPPSRGRDPLQGVGLRARHGSRRPRLLAGAVMTSGARRRQGAGRRPGEDPARCRDRHGRGRRAGRGRPARHHRRLRRGLRCRPVPALARRRPRGRGPRRRDRAGPRGLAGLRTARHRPRRAAGERPRRRAARRARRPGRDGHPPAARPDLHDSRDRA